jgi:hypothetical protein
MILASVTLLVIPLLMTAQQPAQLPSAAGSQPTKPEDLCSIEGRVVNALTGESLKNAQVTLYADSGGEYGEGTDTTGHFIVKDLQPNRYTLSARRNGFAPTQYGARGGSRDGGTPLTLGPGQHTRDIVLRMMPHGVVAGRVLDEDGETVEGVQVNVMRYQSVRGKRQLLPYGSGQTDDLGEYRIFGLQAGKYYLSARYRQSSSMVAEDRTAGAKSDEDYVPTYYPGTSDPTGAVTVGVAAGSILNGMNIKLRRTRTVWVRGHVANSTVEGLPNNVMVHLIPRDQAFFGFFSNQMSRVRKQDGTFELHGVTPGAYTLMTQWWDEGKSFTIRQSLDVGNENIENVGLLLTPGLDLRGLIHVDGPVGGLQLEKLQVELAPDDFLPVNRPSSNVKQDGTFTVESVSTATYTVAVSGLTENFYVKGIHIGDIDVLESGLDLTHGTFGMLDIVVNPSGGQVEGNVQNDARRPAAGATVMLIPSEHRQQLGPLQIVKADQNGTFSIKGIRPGDYKLFAFEHMDSGAYQDPDFLKSYENRGEAVAIREGSRENAQLKVIAAEADTTPTGKNTDN